VKARVTCNRLWRPWRVASAFGMVAAAMTVGSAMAGGAPTGPPQVIGGCTIVANPTPTNYTDCPDADLSGADLAGLDLAYANFTDAKLVHAHLGKTNLTDTALDGAQLWRVSSGGITGSPATLPAHWVLRSGYLVGPGADLAHASLLSDLFRLDIRGAKFYSSDLGSADLALSKLINVDFSKSYLRLADFYRADLTGANFADAFLYTANLTDANLTDATWSHTTCPDGTVSDNDGGTCVNNLG